MLSENVGRRKLSYHSVNKIKGFPASSPYEVICLKLIMNVPLLTEKGTTAIAAELLPWFLEHSVFMGNLHAHAYRSVSKSCCVLHYGNSIIQAFS